jgi:hypothetical protein
MNRLSKLARTTSFGLAFAALLVTVPVAAHNGEDHSVKPAATKTNFCTAVGASTGKIKSSLSEAQSKTDAAINKRGLALSSDRAKWDAELKADRAKWDAQRQENFTKLEAKATTPEQTAAVKAYETAIIEATNTRRAANDAARTAFRNGVDAAVNTQKTAVNNQATAFTNSVTAAIAAAQASCTANPDDSANIRTTLQAALKTARESFSTNRKGDGGIGDTVKALAATRNTAIKANDAAFATATATARTTLKAAFGSTNI